MKYLYILGLLLYSINAFSMPEARAEDNGLIIQSQQNCFYFSYYKQQSLDEVDDPEIQAIFADLVHVADLPRYPELIIYKATKPELKSLTAKALIDNVVVMSDYFIQRIRTLSAGNHQLFQTFMAFVLGHELGHMANKDYQRLHRIHSEPQSSEKVEAYQKQQLEEEADKKGFIYAALAGYPVGTLVANQQHTIFKMLMERIELDNKSKIRTHPYPKKRALKIEQEWSALIKTYPFYEYGVRFAAFGRCMDSQLFFNQFAQVYEGKEMLNNLGLCALQLTKKVMQDAAYLYWLPNILDGDVDSLITMGTSSDSLTSLRSARLDQKVQGNLKKAAYYFKKAIDASPYYFAGYINLSVTYLYLGQPEDARYFVRKGLKKYQEAMQQPNQRLKPAAMMEAYLKMLLYLSNYEYDVGSSTPWRKVVDDLIALLKQYDEPLPEVVFNIARLLDIYSRTGEAQKYWHLLTEDNMRLHLPKPILETVCNKQQGMDNLKCITKASTTIAEKQWHYPFNITAEALYNQESIYEKIDHNWIKLLDGSAIEGTQVFLYQEAETKNWELLALDSYVGPALFINKQPNETLENLDQYCTSKPYKKTMANSDIYFCADWAAKVIDGKITEVWKEIR